jgi:hypothetical protein
LTQTIPVNTSILKWARETSGVYKRPAAVFKEVYTHFNEKNISELADTFKVSREVVLRKYLDFNLITPDIYKSYTEKWLKEYFD